MADDPDTAPPEGVERIASEVHVDARLRKNDTSDLLFASALASGEMKPDKFAAVTLSWSRQFEYVVYKNILLLMRRRVTGLCLLFSSVVCALITWAVAPNYDGDLPPYSECGVITWDYMNSTREYSHPDNFYSNPPALGLNDKWTDGIAAALLSLGPMILAICAFLVVSEEIQSQMTEVLRGLGLRESVYWASWYFVFAVIAFVNAFLGAIAAKATPVAAFDNIYFFGICFSLFFLSLALISCSFMLAALCGTRKRLAIWLVLCMLTAPWIPRIILGTQASPFNASDMYNNGNDGESPSGLFPQMIDTNSFSKSTYVPVENGTAYYYLYEQCSIPVMGEEEGTRIKTEEERAELTGEDFFLGCYSAAGFTATSWNPNGGKGGLAAFFMFPYFHFTTMWSNMLGYTQIPGNKFKAKHSGMSPEKLVKEWLPEDAGDSWGTTLFPHGTMIQKAYLKDAWDSPCLKYSPEGWCEDRGSTLPLPDDPNYNFCSFDNSYPSHAVQTPSESPSTRAMMGFLMAISAIYFFLALYFATLFGGGYKFYFPFQVSFWFGEKSSQKESEAEAIDGVKVDSVKKVYGDFEAIKGVSMKLERGEVLALLGHNGAGKTTLSKVLTCETPATEGDITVFGHSVSRDPFAVRRMIGVCKQDDYLYKDLTAKEHLELFAGLRGVDRADIGSTVQKWLESVALDDVQMQCPPSFSGGMKRRLSVALATIGDRPVIVLDEPTTGMDPISRRYVWRHVDEIKSGRVIFLTTHAMEEADLLADSVAIMKKGELAAFGTPLQLKADHGSPLQFSILVTQTKVSEFEKKARKHFSTDEKFVTIDADATGNVTLSVHSIKKGDNEGVDVQVLSDFVEWLDKDTSVEEYGFSNSSLEEVFLKVTSHEKQDEEEQGENEEMMKSSRFMSSVDFDDAPLEESENIVMFEPTLNVSSQAKTIVWFHFLRSWTGKKSLGNYILFGLFIVAMLIVGLAQANTYENTKINMFSMTTAFLSLLLVSILIPIYEDENEGQLYLVRSNGLLSASYLCGTGCYAFLVQLVYGLVLLLLFFATPYFREPEICDQTDETYCYNAWGWGDPRTYTLSELSSNQISFYRDDGLTNEQGEPLELMLYAVPTAAIAGSAGRLIGTALFFALAMPGATFISSYMPGYKIALILTLTFIVIASLIPLIPIFQFESEAQEECMQNIDPSGLCNTTLYHFTSQNTTEDFLNCVGIRINDLAALCTPAFHGLLPQSGVFQTMAMTLIGGVTFYSEPSWYVKQVLIPSIEEFGNCNGSTCVFPYAKELYQTNLGYMLLGSVILLIFGIILVRFLSFPNKAVLTCTHRIKNVMSHLNPCNWCQRGLKDDTENSNLEELEEVVKEREIVRGHVDTFLVKPDADNLEAGRVGNPQIDHSSIPRGDVPPVLVHKLRKVYPALGGRPPKIALNSLDLHVSKGQVLGLLGKNGAGKTTALKILANAHDATSGVALVGGYDVDTEEISVFERLGNCPQFDVIWPAESVKHHLQFFAGLKGLPSDRIEEATRSIATAVGLGAPEVFVRPAGALSGGMRRRLSIAISLIGAPKVILLDEPSTGLDPSTRNSIWKLVNSVATKERAVIITTHTMIEADVLCDRIAIMSRGNLKVVATQQTLKDKFGSGYLLQLNLLQSTSENIENAMKFILDRVHSGAILAAKQAKTLRINLPRAGLDLKVVFRELYSDEASNVGGINQFLLSQASLEDVFVSLGDD